MPATGCAPLFKGLLKGHSTPQQLCLVQPSESSAKDASPWGTPIRALHRVHVLGVHLCKGCKFLRYIYHRALQKVQVLVVHLSESSAKGASPCGTPITELCKGCKSLWYIYQSTAKGASPCCTFIKAPQRVQVLVVHLSQSSAKGASPCGTSITELCKGCKSLWYIYHRALQRVKVLVVHLSQSSCKGCKSSRYTYQSSAKGASPCCTFIKALQRVQVLVVQLSHSSCKGWKSSRYTYQSFAKGASPCLSQSSAKCSSPWGTPIPELCKEWHAPIRELCKRCTSLRYTYQNYPKGTCPQTAPIGDLCYQTALQREHHKSLTMVHFLKPLQKSQCTQNPCSTPPWTCTPWSQDAAQDGLTMHSRRKATPPQEPQSDSHLMGREEGIQKTNTVQNTGGRAERAGRSWPQLGNHWEVGQG